MNATITEAVALVAACMAREIGDAAVIAERKRLQAERKTKTRETSNDDDR